MIGEFPVDGHTVIVERRGVDDSPSGVEKRGKRGSCHRVRTYGNSMIVLSRCEEDWRLIVYLKTPSTRRCSRIGQEESYKLVFNIVFCIPEHSSLLTLHLPFATF